jgi:hypothetical protein
MRKARRHRRVVLDVQVATPARSHR